MEQAPLTKILDFINSYAVQKNKNFMPARSQKKPFSKPTYLREILIRYKKKKVTGKLTPVGTKIKGAQQVVQLFSDLQDEAKEKLIGISLDAKLKIICFEVIAVGSLTAVYARPAEILRAPIMVNAHGLILVHNHPSGDPAPSKRDKSFTSQLLIHTKGLGIELHDHIIIGDEDYFSFAEKGLMKRV